MNEEILNPSLIKKEETIIERTLFEGASFPGDKMMILHPFYEWLFENSEFHPFKRHKKGTFSKQRIIHYLESIGYDKEKHFLSRDDLQTLKWVMEEFLQNHKVRSFSFSFSDLFEETGKDNKDSFWIRGRGHYKPTEKMKRFFLVHGGIFELSPKEYHFSIEGSILEVIYNKIIGGRRLCKLN